MKCAEFNKMLLDYIDNNLDYDKKTKMEEHLKTCNSCSAKIEKSKLFSQNLSQHYKNNISFESKLNNIMNYANSNKYKASIQERLAHRFKKHMTAYALCTLSVIILFTAKPYIFEISKNLSYRLNTEKPIVNDDSVKVETYIDYAHTYMFFDEFPKPVDFDSELYSDICSRIYKLSSKIDSNTTDSSKIYEILKNDSDYKYIISKGNTALNITLNRLDHDANSDLTNKIEAIICKELLGEDMNSINIPNGIAWYAEYFNKINPQAKLIFDNNSPLISSIVSSTKKSEIEALLKEIKNTKVSNDAPSKFYVRYSNSNKIIFCNNKFIIVYDNTDGIRGINNIIKAKKPDNKFPEDNFNYLQCEEISPDGNYALISFYSDPLKYNYKENLIYVYDFKTDSYTFIGKGFDLSNSIWSPSSNYFITKSYSNNESIVFNTVNKTIKTLNTKESFNSTFVSDEGNVLLSSSNIKHYLVSKNDYNNLKEVAIIGIPLNFDSEGIQYWDTNGNIKNYNISSAESSLLKNIGSNFKIMDTNNGFLHNKTTAIFKHESSFKGYDIFEKNVRTLSNNLLNNYDYIQTFSPSITKSITGTAFMHPGIKNSDGVIKTMNIDFRYDALNWIDDNTLIAIIHKKNNTFLGDFQLVQIDALSGEAKVILEP
jgi:hypothetical protein